jgi:glycerol-3-phosphate acyltransferase PlsY
MGTIQEIGYLLIAYFIGAIPFGWIIVMLKTGKDIRDVQSGRTGGTNAMRAAGFVTGISTALLDVLKSASTVWIAKGLFPDAIWIHTLAPIAAIIGHNYSIFLIKRYDDGKIKLGGGAGGGATLGGVIGLESWRSGLVIFFVSLAVWYFVGYASVTTMGIALLAIIIFVLRAVNGLSPWAYVVYGVLAEALLLWALRPNIKALRAGTERLHGFRARKKKKEESQTAE